MVMTLHPAAPNARVHKRTSKRPTAGRTKKKYNSKEISALLCGVLTALETSNELGSVLNKVNWTEVGLTRAQLTEWWDVHKKEDASRIKVERIFDGVTKELNVKELSALTKKLMNRKLAP